MKKTMVFITIILAAFIFIFFAKEDVSNSKIYGNSVQITTLMGDYEKECGHELKLATKGMEQKLYGKWDIGKTLGYSLKYDVTGGALYEGKLDLSKEAFTIKTLLPVPNKNPSSTTKFAYLPTIYKKPVFAYYRETMEQMKNDDFLDNYTGIIDVKPNTAGTVIITMGIPSDSPGSYEIISTKFIMIENYIIAVDQSTFYKLIK